MAPIIGITVISDMRNTPSNDYIHAIKEFGGIPRPLYPGISEDADADINGLLLTGGLDMDPSSYGEAAHETTEPAPARDALELPVFKRSLAEDLPIFGICRGMQVMNVALGGSLFQDIPSHLPLQFPNFPVHRIKIGDSEHPIEIKTDSLLHQIIGERAATVNSRHHQSVKVIGDGFRVTAQSEDGIIEAIESPLHRFLLGVQYHPERMLETSSFREHRRQLFAAFIQAASA